MFVGFALKKDFIRNWYALVVVKVIFLFGYGEFCEKDVFNDFLPEKIRRFQYSWIVELCRPDVPKSLFSQILWTTYVDVVGSMGGVHLQCLENWIRVKDMRKCEVCDEDYKISRILKYGRINSILPFIKSQKAIFANGLLRALVIFFLITIKNLSIAYMQENWRCDYLNFFIRFHFFIVSFFLYYFFLLECVCEVHHIYNSWRTWRSSIFTIHLL